jgi:hypothetical protein
MEQVSMNKETQADFLVFSKGYDAAVEDIITTFENLDSDKARWAINIINGGK